MSEGTEVQVRTVGGMNPRASARLAWSLCAVALVLTALALLLLDRNLAHPNAYIYDYWLDNTLAAISYAPVGALIAARRPSNPVGWLLCLWGVVLSIGHFSARYRRLRSIGRTAIATGGRSDGLDRFLDTPYHHRRSGARLPAFPYRAITKQALEVVRVADRGFRYRRFDHLLRSRSERTSVLARYPIP